MIISIPRPIHEPAKRPSTVAASASAREKGEQRGGALEREDERREQHADLLGLVGRDPAVVQRGEQQHADAESEEAERQRGRHRAQRDGERGARLSVAVHGRSLPARTAG
jgi:hypothetical protein